MKRFSTLILAALSLPMTMMGQGWPSDYNGVMLQGFYWDSFTQSAWTKLESRAGDFKGYFDLVWVPQSGKCLNSTSMGYDPYYFFNQNSSFGTADELKSMITTFKDNGIGTIADVVVNHHGTTGWWSFPSETYNGTTYQLQTTDIVANDDNGGAATQAATDGVTLSTNNDEGEDWSGMRDLDHNSTNVQNIVKAYEQYLVNDLGYTGFRYDMVKGFDGSHVGDYNTAAGVDYSVGECWDSNSTIESWINATGKRSAAFDFQFRYNVRDAVNGASGSTLTSAPNWSLLNSTNNLMHDTNYRQYAVTFVENHDTEQRTDDNQDPIWRDTLAANAYLLAMPGTPCVFYTHYLAYPDEIKAMIDARKAAGITNMSDYTNYRSATAYYANAVTGKNGTLLVFVGSGYPEPASTRYVKVLSGYHYAYYLSLSTEVAFADKPSGSYSEAFTTTLTAVSATTDAQLVYTTDGSQPTATNGTVVASGSTVSITTDCTLTVGLLVNGTVTSTIVRNYTFADPNAVTYETPESGYTYHAYFIAPSTWSADTEVYAWAWIENGANYTPDNTATWPGDKGHVYRIGKSADGGFVWEWCYYGTETVPPAYIIFNNGSSGVGTNQTANMTFTDGGWYDMSTTVTNPTLGITGTSTTSTENDTWYTLTGVSISKPTQKGIYIHNGRKVIVR
ncbi:MAG: alpha-amylase [Prevotella sp.]|nr:alpha-amylase [Prevotella sp.]